MYLLGQGNKGKHKQIGLYQIKNIIKMKSEPTIWYNIFANDTMEKGLISKI